MEAQEAPHNTDPTPASPSQTGAPARNNDPEAQPALQHSSGTREQLPGTGREETTVKVTVERETEKDLVKTETDVVVEMEKGGRAVQVTEHKTEKVLTNAGARVSESAEVEGAVKVFRVAEEDAKHLLAEAEEHETVLVAMEDAKTFEIFWLKSLNDWILNFSAGLAYNLLMAVFPIVIALGATIGFISGNLSPQNQQALVTRLSAVFPSVLGQNVLAPSLVLLHKDAGGLGLLAIILALYSGSRLFVAMENYFAIIYHTPTRPYLRKNLMALVMLLIFIVLIPIMLLASSIGLGGFLEGLVAAVLLFQAIYMIVPNQHISLRNSWRGTLVAAVALQVYIALFPLYIRSFLGSYTGNVGFAVILLLFFYYFAVILLLGAEVNAYYAENVRARPRSIAELVHLATLEADKAEIEELARQKAAHHPKKPVK